MVRARPRSWTWCLAACLLWFLATTVDVLSSGPLSRWDARIQARVTPVEAGWPTDVATVLADAGHWPVQGGFLLLLAVVLAGATRRVRPVVVAMAGLATVGAVGAGLKVVLGRTAPWEGTDQVFTESSAYPSGHAAGAVVVGLLAARIVAQASPMTPHLRWLRRIVVVVGVSWPVLMGWSRIHLGVHWASDVLGGWSLGLAIVLVVLHAESLPKTMDQSASVVHWRDKSTHGHVSRSPAGPLAGRSDLEVHDEALTPPTVRTDVADAATSSSRRPARFPRFPRGRRTDVDGCSGHDGRG